MNKSKPLTEAERARLLRVATEVATKAYAPYSKFRVGAAVLGETETYLGVNVENASYGLALCAERAALSAAVTAGEGERNVRAIAIACIDASGQSARMPCGACRQWLLELAPGAEVLISGMNGHFRVEELLPNPFQA